MICGHENNGQTMGLQLNVACEREGGTNILGGHKVAVAEVNVPVLCEEKKTHSARGPNSEPCVCGCLLSYPESTTPSLIRKQGSTVDYVLWPASMNTILNFRVL